jgi:hypothetical protein
MFSQSPKKLPISDSGSIELHGATMSGSARWKENRIRQEIYLEQVKHREMSPNRADVHGPNSQGQTPVLFLQQTLSNRSDKRILNRSKKNQLRWMILRVALLAAGVAVCLWVYLGQFGIR